MSATPVDLSALPRQRRDPVAIIAEQNATRLQDLVPVRIGRMLQSPFAFYRGSAALMAADLSATSSSTQYVLACGDAHVANFGLFASPERRLVADLNDFDEAGIAPWEWDLKRLVASIHLAALDNGGSAQLAAKAVAKASRAYRRTIAALAERSELERFYLSVDIGYLTENFGRGANRDRIARLEKRARRKTSAAALRKLTVTTAEGHPRIVDQPPLMRHTDDVMAERLADQWGAYFQTCSPEIRYLLSGFTLVDFALRVVGVGSVGTRCFVILLVGASGEPLFLQVKEAGPSVLETYGGIDQSTFVNGILAGERNNAYRVVASQRTLQAHSDPFLGWAGELAADQGVATHSAFYVRQLRDMKGSLELSAVNGDQLVQVAKVCAGLLARAHAQSAQVTEIAALYGRHRELDEQMVEFAAGYAGLVQADYDALAAAVEDGVLPCERGV